ncbi:MAG: SIMPL domain-containing protein [Chitinophagaceae bacterium]
MKKIFATLILASGFIFAKAQQITATITPPQKTISVNGSAEKEITPDEIYVQIDLREYDKKGADIQTIKNDFLQVCKNMGLADSDVVVQGYSGWDGNYWWYEKKKKQNPDLKASISYWVKVKTTDEMDQLVNKLDDQATQNFFIAKTDYSKMDELKKQLKIEAIKSAKNKAIYLAESIGENVGEAITINDPSETNNYPRPLMYSNAMAKTAEADQQENAAPMNVDFQKIKIQFEVNVVFALK